MNKRKDRSKKRLEFKDQIIQRKNDEIESLKKTILDLKIEQDEKDNIIHSVDSIREEFKDIVNGLKDKEKEYDELIHDLRMMKNVMNQTVFKGRWKLVKFLIR